MTEHVDSELCACEPVVCPQLGADRVRHRVRMHDALGQPFTRLTCFSRIPAPCQVSQRVSAARKRFEGVD